MNTTLYIVIGIGLLSVLLFAHFWQKKSDIDRKNNQDRLNESLAMQKQGQEKYIEYTEKYLRNQETIINLLQQIAEQTKPRN